MVLPVILHVNTCLIDCLLLWTEMSFDNKFTLLFKCLLLSFASIDILWMKRNKFTYSLIPIMIVYFSRIYVDIIIIEYCSIRVFSKHIHVAWLVSDVSALIRSKYKTRLTGIISYYIGLLNFIVYMFLELISSYLALVLLKSIRIPISLFIIAYFISSIIILKHKLNQLIWFKNAKIMKN